MARCSSGHTPHGGGSSSPREGPTVLGGAIVLPLHPHHIFQGTWLMPVFRDRANNANNLIYVSAFYLFHKYNTGINYLSLIKQELLRYMLSKMEAHINIWCHSMKEKVKKKNMVTKQ